MTKGTIISMVVWVLIAVLIALAGFSFAMAVLVKGGAFDGKPISSYTVQADPAGPRCFDAIVNAEPATICRLGGHKNHD